MKIKNIFIATVIAITFTTLLIAQTKNSKTQTATVNPPDSLMTKAMQQSMTPQQALQKLKDGNKRFVSGANIHRNYADAVHQTSIGQYPSAIKAHQTK